MKKYILPVLLNVFTLIGGQFLVKRQDRAMLVFAMYLYMWIGLSVYFSVIFTTQVASGSVDFISVYKDIVIFGAYGLGIIWFFSLILLLLGLFQQTASESSNLTISGVTGSVLLSLLCAVMMGYQISTIPIVNKMDAMLSDGGGNETISFSSRRYFSSHVYFGEDYDKRERHGEPKVGDGYLQGRITYKGEPVKNIKLDIKLNNKFTTAELLTDDEGTFTIRVEPGEWYVNSIYARRWEEMPEGNFMMVSGEEKDYKARNYVKRDFRNKKGLLVNVTTEKGAPAINLEIKPAIGVVWPAASDDLIEADSRSDVIEWKSVEDAGKYLVEISTITRNGESKSWSTTFHATTALPRLPLSDVRTTSTEGQNQEYVVEVTAFTEDGRFISETGYSSAERIFTLEPGMIIIDEDVTDFLDVDFTEFDYESARKEKEKAKAIKVLIREGMYKEADSLLSSLSSDKIDPGEEPALRGYLAAAKGNCDVANKLFTVAKSIGGKSCVPGGYYADCKK